MTLDPEYDLAWAGLADAYAAHGYYAFARAKNSMPKGMDAVRHAREAFETHDPHCQFFT